MRDALLAAMGVIVEWGCTFLLLLLFVRLGRGATHRRAIRIWAIAWGVETVALSGPFVHAVGILRNESNFAFDVAYWLGLLYVPGMLLFFVVAAVGALRAVDRTVPPMVVRIISIAALGAGIAAAFINEPMLIGGVLIGAAVPIFFGMGIGIGREERRERPARLPLLSITMFLAGAISVLFHVAAYFSNVVSLGDDELLLINWTSGYAGAFASLALAGAVITLLLDDAFRGTVATSSTPRAAAPPTSETVRPHPVWPVVHVSAEPVVDVETEAVVVEEIASLPSADRASGADRVPLPPVIVTHVSDEGVSREVTPRPRTVVLPRPPMVHGHRGEVLVIDDEAAIRATLARVFQRGGWGVRDFSTGEEALAWLLDIPLDRAPAVIVCDVQMPGMGGREIHEHLLTDRPELAERLLFISGDVDSTNARTFLLSTGRPFVRKPFTITEISEAVEQLLAPTVSPAA